MTKAELAERLNHLDPGASLRVDADRLAGAFGADRLTQEIVQSVEAFALEHRCSFLYDEATRQPPVFEKDDIF